MYKALNYLELEIDGNYVLVDVRSNGEYQEFSIPGAVNVPIFNNEERSIIGTIYKNESVEKAKRIGIQMVSAKLLELYETFSALKNQYREVYIYCERGGMRSSSLWSLFNSIGLRVIKLEGGYKGYRAVVNEYLPKLLEDITFIMLHGHTGTGKTQLLQRLEQKGLEVLDLEGYANHRGSLLGDVGMYGRVSQRQFEALVFEKLRRRKSNYVLIEAESGRIGNIIVPQFMHNKMKQGIHIMVEGSLEARAERIVREYVVNESSKEEILKALDSFSRYVGDRRAKQILQLVEEESYSEAAVELMLVHYDPLYSKAQNKFNYSLTVNSDDAEAAVERIRQFTQSLIMEA